MRIDYILLKLFTHQKKVSIALGFDEQIKFKLSNFGDNQFKYYWAFKILYNKIGYELIWFQFSNTMF